MGEIEQRIQIKSGEGLMSARYRPAKSQWVEQARIDRDISGRKISTTVSRAYVVFWHYSRQNFGVPAGSIVSGDRGSLTRKEPASDREIYSVVQGLIEDEICDINVNKSIDTPSGSFRITILPSKNWKTEISPGDWLAIYLSSEGEDFNSSSPGTKNMVMFGSVDRISRTKQREEDSDRVVVRYVISGRDFGKVLEDTDIWFNPFTRPQDQRDLVLTMAGLQFTGSPNDFFEQVINIFLKEESADIFGSLPTGAGLTDVALKQNFVPTQIADIFSTLSDTRIPSYVPRKLYRPFGDIIKTRTTTLPGHKPRTMLSPAASAGSLWGYLKRESNALVNDLYCELAIDGDGNKIPTLTLLPHPNSPFFKDIPGQLDGGYLILQDLPTIEIDESMIKYEDTGRDSNSRINMVYLSTRESKTSAVHNLAYIGVMKDGIGLPMYQSESINRHGLKIMEQSLDYCYSQKESSASVNTNIELFRSFINQIFDLNAYNHLYETGTIVSAGTSYAQVGACLQVSGGSEKKDKIYYIEGYSHTFTFPNQWETEFQVTQGQFNSRTNPFIDSSATDSGQIDADSVSRYLVKTNVRRKNNSPFDPTKIA